MEGGKERGRGWREGGRDGEREGEGTEGEEIEGEVLKVGFLLIVVKGIAITLNRMIVQDTEIYFS